MGTYTAMIFFASLKDDIPSDVSAVLDYLFGSRERPTDLPDHPFFKTGRWSQVGRSASVYFFGFNVVRKMWNHPVAGRSIFTAFSMKNYDGEIEHFLDWINPHLSDERSFHGMIIEEDGSIRTIQRTSAR